MGQEARATVRFDGQTSEGRALLESDELLFRGEFRLAVPLASVSSVVAEGGRLAVRFPEGTAVFQLAPELAADQQARLVERWAERIRHPKSTIDKLGLRQGWKVAVIGIDHGFTREVEEATGRSPLRRAGASCDAIFFAVRSRHDLNRLERLVPSLKPEGALWVVRPKGNKAVGEGPVLEAGRRAGLVDVKVVRFSDTHTAEKFVIPRERRDRHPGA